MTTWGILGAVSAAVLVLGAVLLRNPGVVLYDMMASHLRKSPAVALQAGTARRDERSAVKRAPGAILVNKPAQQPGAFGLLSLNGDGTEA